MGKHLDEFCLHCLFLIVNNCEWMALFVAICACCITGISMLLIVGDGSGRIGSNRRTDGRKVSDELAGGGKCREQVVGG